MPDKVDFQALALRLKADSVRRMLADAAQAAADGTLVVRPRPPGSKVPYVRELRVPGAAVNFKALIEAARALAPKCPKCSGPLHDEVGQCKVIHPEDGGRPVRVCCGCFYTELGDRLVVDTPH